MRFTSRQKNRPEIQLTSPVDSNRKAYRLGSPGSSKNVNQEDTTFLARRMQQMLLESPSVKAQSNPFRKLPVADHLKTYLHNRPPKASIDRVVSLSSYRKPPPQLDQFNQDVPLHPKTQVKLRKKQNPFQNDIYFNPSSFHNSKPSVQSNNHNQSEPLVPMFSTATTTQSQVPRIQNFMQRNESKRTQRVNSDRDEVPPEQQTSIQSTTRHDQITNKDDSKQDVNQNVLDKQMQVFRSLQQSRERVTSREKNRPREDNINTFSKTTYPLFRQNDLQHPTDLSRVNQQFSNQLTLEALPPIPAASFNTPHKLALVKNPSHESQRETEQKTTYQRSISYLRNQKQPVQEPAIIRQQTDPSIKHPTLIDQTRQPTVLTAKPTQIQSQIGLESTSKSKYRLSPAIINETQSIRSGNSSPQRVSPPPHHQEKTITSSFKESPKQAFESIRKSVPHIVSSSRSPRTASVNEKTILQDKSYMDKDFQAFSEINEAIELEFQSDKTQVNHQQQQVTKQLALSQQQPLTQQQQATYQQQVEQHQQLQIQRESQLQQQMAQLQRHQQQQQQHLIEQVRQEQQRMQQIAEEQQQQIKVEMQKRLQLEQQQEQDRLNRIQLQQELDSERERLMQQTLVEQQLQKQQVADQMAEKEAQMQKLKDEIERQRLLALVPDEVVHLEMPCYQPALPLLNDVQLDLPECDQWQPKPLDFEDTATEGEILSALSDTTGDQDQFESCEVNGKQEIAIQTSSLHFKRILQKPIFKKMLQTHKYSTDWAMSPLYSEIISPNVNYQRQTDQSCQIEESMLVPIQMLSQLECEYQSETLKKTGTFSPVLWDQGLMTLRELMWQLRLCKEWETQTEQQFVERDTEHLIVLLVRCYKMYEARQQICKVLKIIGELTRLQLKLDKCNTCEAVEAQKVIDRLESRAEVQIQTLQDEHRILKRPFVIRGIQYFNQL